MAAWRNASRLPVPARFAIEIGGVVSGRPQAWFASNSLHRTPYLHPRVTPVEHGGNDGRPVQMVMSVEFVAARDGRPVPPDLPANVARLPLAKTS
jgi:hypothetical protein